MQFPDARTAAIRALYYGRLDRFVSAYRPDHPAVVTKPAEWTPLESWPP